MPDNKHNEIMHELGILQGKQDGIIQRLDTLNGKVIKHDDQLNSLELWRGNIKGLITVITAVISVAISVGIAAIKWYWGK